jgi:hypothetical protein
MCFRNFSPGLNHRAWSEAGARPSTEQRVPKDIHRATAKPGIPRLLDESATTTF